jgi:hypothetical protein
MKNLIEGEEGEDDIEATPGAEGAEPGVNPEDNADALSEFKPLKFKDPMELSFLAPMPYRIEVATIPNLNDLRSIWRGGMGDLEQSFMTLIQKMNLAFE